MLRVAPRGRQRNPRLGTCPHTPRPLPCYIALLTRGSSNRCSRCIPRAAHTPCVTRAAVRFGLFCAPARMACPKQPCRARVSGHVLGRRGSACMACGRPRRFTPAAARRCFAPSACARPPPCHSAPRRRASLSAAPWAPFGHSHMRGSLPAHVGAAAKPLRPKRAGGRRTVAYRSAVLLPLLARRPLRAIARDPKSPCLGGGLFGSRHTPQRHIPLRSPPAPVQHRRDSFWGFY